MRELPIHIQLNPQGGKTLYEQIYEYIRDEIKSGRLLQDEKLPSTRFLAEYLGVSRTTVDMAYGQLVSEGYLEARPQRGYFVAASENIYAFDAMPDREIKAEAAKAQKQQFRYDFSPTAIDMGYFPYATWKKITKNTMIDANSKMFSLGEPQGDEELRGTICRYLHGSRGVNCEPEQIIIGAGNDFLLLLLEKILGRHIHIAMENPTYVRAYQIFRSFAYPVSLVPMDEHGMVVERLRETDASIAYVMPSHQYPMGISMPIGRRMELLKWAVEGKERYLIEDDYDSEFRYKGKPLPSLQASDTNGKVIYIGTFSKSIAPAIRISYMVLPYRLLERYREECGFYSSTVSRIDQTILNEFIRDGYFERYLNKMRKVYRTKRDVLMRELIPLEKAFRISGGNAGLHVLLEDKKGRDEDALVESAKKLGVKVYGLDAFRLGQVSHNQISGRSGKRMRETGPQDASAVILGYGALSADEIKQGISLLKEAWG